ncbi:MAG: aspartyl protease family protein [Spirulina sp.]
MGWQGLLRTAAVVGMGVALAGCGGSLRPLASQPPTASTPVSAPSPADQTAPPATTQAVVEASPSTAQPDAPADTQPDYFREAVNRATSAMVLGQSAQSQADWQLAVGRWQQAVDLMKQVPTDSPNHAQAQAKVQEYQRNLAAAQQRATGQPTTPPPAAPVTAPDGLVAQIPILDRRGGTPVVEVAFQGQRGSHRFPMLFDTGATGTLITAEMAEQIGVVIVGSTQVKIADGSVVSLPIGYVDFIEVGGLRKTSMVVAIGGSVGLLGQDVYGEFGIAMGSHIINLHK